METTGLFLTDSDLADRWRTSVNAIRILRHRGGGPAFVRRATRGVLYPLEEVERFERERLVDPAASR